MSGSVVVVGSVNLDVSVTVDRLPAPGETLLGGTVRRSGGGKGANQAVAAARAGGARTAMVGAVGDDPDGAALRASLESDGIDCSCLTTSASPTGTALITVDRSGENTIVVAAGANDDVRLDDAAAALVRAADVVLAQLEIPQPTVLAAARARRPDALLVLNAAPYAAVDADLLAAVDLLVVNEHEALGLSAAPTVDEAVQSLLESVPAVLVTLGAAGARLDRRGGRTTVVPAPRVDAVDTTGAGDTFCGVLGAALARGDDDLSALRLASAAASVAVEGKGAQDAVPSAARTRERALTAYGLGEEDSRG
ncbi:PfkB family carbohydrate kinase [Terrabacter sp. MAHUQ-38]|jgi:ribokinase|uniref:PfkB family carbohydrate kinase n=1 Tax=unclassified Terrabacter TaxID=2630222 RepID=UPI00165DAD3D|nr:PfkB family carbohydrate kinase [Terrabacter sp. MAHUQ-38]MBC9821030.1 bifunctional hydroxymethylpyrimidine kinase/phosphomethylpyrimidine kinase [Terrabacter sp. MAHUQ-38]